MVLNGATTQHNVGFELTAIQKYRERSMLRAVARGLAVAALLSAVAAQQDAASQIEINKLFDATDIPFVGASFTAGVYATTSTAAARTVYSKRQVDAKVTGLFDAGQTQSVFSQAQVLGQINNIYEPALPATDNKKVLTRTQTQAKFDALYTPNVLPLAETDVRRRVYTQNEVDRIRDELQHDIDENRIDIARNMRMIQLEQMSVDVAWLVTCGALVFFMQAGFAMLEAGIVHPKNVSNILFKNMIDASIAAICFWTLGYGFAYGEDVGGFIGKDSFANNAIYNGAGGPYTIEGGYSSDGWESWFFQWAFTGACATIVAGSVAERTKLEAYFVYSIILTTFIYPIVVHWGWGSGFLSAWGAYPDENDEPRPLFQQNSESNGMIDFAGSGVVHMVGGFSGLMGAIVVGPRKGRFEPYYVMYEGNHHLQALGVFILWFGWYGFNCGSTLAISAGVANIAAKVAFTTTISAASGCITATVLARLVQGTYDITIGLNGILAGLVSITANCSVVDPWHALLIGMAGAVIFYCGHHLLIFIKVDDPCDACVVHGFCGCWGIWAVGIFCTDSNIQYAAYPNVNDACKRGEQFGVQVVGSLAIIAWTCATAGALFLTISLTIGMRVSDEVEEAGLDVSEHGLSKPNMVEIGGGYPPTAQTYSQPAPEPVKDTRAMDMVYAQPQPEPPMQQQIQYPAQGPGLYVSQPAPQAAEPPGVPSYYANAPPGYDASEMPPQIQNMVPAPSQPPTNPGMYSSMPAYPQQGVYPHPVYATQPAPDLYSSQPQFIQS